MLYAGRQIGKIIHSHRLGLVAELQGSAAVNNEIEILLTIAENGLAIAIGINRDLCKASHALHDTAILIAFAEDGFIVAGLRSHFVGSVAEVRHVAPQPGWINPAFLGKQRRRDEYDQQNEPQVQSSERLRSFAIEKLVYHKNP